ncbi:hypothetical protein K438DRAFT_1762046 [Mycena galopus ATCC 62051]|nr:hypothetical protein K438DRAFT_1762046 [Mycena galopus ATCC 62051]
MCAIKSAQSRAGGRRGKTGSKGAEEPTTRSAAASVAASGDEEGVGSARAHPYSSNRSCTERSHFASPKQARIQARTRRAKLARRRATSGRTAESAVRILHQGVDSCVRRALECDWGAASSRFGESETGGGSQLISRHSSRSVPNRTDVAASASEFARTWERGKAAEGWILNTSAAEQLTHGAESRSQSTTWLHWQLVVDDGRFERNTKRSKVTQVSTSGEESAYAIGGLFCMERVQENTPDHRLCRNSSRDEFESSPKCTIQLAVRKDTMDMERQNSDAHTSEYRPLKMRREPRAAPGTIPEVEYIKARPQLAKQQQPARRPGMSPPSSLSNLFSSLFSSLPLIFSSSTLEWIMCRPCRFHGIVRKRHARISRELFEKNSGGECDLRVKRHKTEQPTDLVPNREEKAEGADHGRLADSGTNRLPREGEFSESARNARTAGTSLEEGDAYGRLAVGVDAGRACATWAVTM